MAHCQKCKKKLPFFSLRDAKRPNPLGEGKLCPKCYQPYGLVLEKYTESLDLAATDPKAVAWVALCYLLAAQRINLVRTVTAALVGFSEMQNSWEVCRQKTMELATKATRMLAPDSEGQVFMKSLFAGAQKITKSPSRQIPIQRHASVWGDTIRDIEHEAVVRSGISMDEINNYIASIPGHQWLVP